MVLDYNPWESGERDVQSFIGIIPRKRGWILFCKLLERIPNPIVRAGRCEMIPPLFTLGFLFLSFTIDDLSECAVGSVHHLHICGGYELTNSKYPRAREETPVQFRHHLISVRR